MVKDSGRVSGSREPSPSSSTAGLGPSGFDPARGEHGLCANCGANLDGGSIWETGLQMALSGALFVQRGQPAPTQSDAERLADDYAAAYGAHRTRGQWSRAILYKPEDEYCCPDCEHRWPAPWRHDAIATEARRAATGNTDAVEDEGAGPQDIAQTPNLSGNMGKGE